MADFPIYRLVKGSQLTFEEMDDNMRWLSQNMSGSNVTISGSVFISGSGVSLVSGSFSGSGALLYDIPAASIVGLNLSRIVSGSATASISPNKGLEVNTSIVQGSGSAAYGYSNLVNGRGDGPFTTESISRIQFAYPTSSTGYSTGISEDRKTVYKYLTGSVAGISPFVISSNLLNSTYRYALDTIGYPITDYTFALNNSDVITYKGNSNFSTASLTTTGSFSTSSYISGVSVMSYSLSDPLPENIGLSRSEISHIVFAKSESLSYVNLGTSSLNKVWEGYQDDSPVIPVAAPFPINFLGKKYNTVYVTGNGYIMFDSITNSVGAYFAPLASASVPPIPNIKVGASDLSLYKVYSGSTAETFRIWVQERSDYPIGTPDREYSYIFYSGSERIDLYVDRMVLSTRVITSTGTIQQISRISDGYTTYSDFSSSIYSGSGYALNLWNPAITSSTVAVKQISGNTITAYGSASINTDLINQNLYSVSLDKRLFTSSQYPLTSYSIKNTSSLQDFVISSVSYDSGTDSTSIVVASNLKMNYTASIFSSSYINLDSNNYIDFSVDYMSGSTIKSNNVNSNFYGFLAYPFTASLVTLYKNSGYTNNLQLLSDTQRAAFKIISSSYSGDITGSLFISYSVIPIGSYETVAYGEYSQAAGLGVVASSSYQYVLGQYNQLNDISSTFVVGGGSSALSRKNLFSVNQSAATITGSLSLSGDISYASSSYRISRNGSTFSSSIALTGFLSVVNPNGSGSYIKGSGSAVFKVDGNYSNLITAEDDNVSGSYSSSIFSINDLMGLPIFDTFYDGKVKMYEYPDVVFEKSGSSFYIGNTFLTESKVVVKNNITLDRGDGVIHATIQSTGSTLGLVTSSLNKYVFGLDSASLYYNAIVSGYDTGSRQMIVGDVKSTIKFVNGVATTIGTNVKFINAEDSTVSFDVVSGGTSASLQVYGSSDKAYNWAATITTQKF